LRGIIYIVKHLLFVGGIGANAEATPSFREIAHQIQSLHSARVSYVNGAQFDQNPEQLRVMRPSEQLRTIRTVIGRDERIGIIGHCFGAVPVLEALEGWSTKSKAIIIAPPLPNPHTVYTQVISKKIDTFGGLLPTYWWAGLGEDTPPETRLIGAKVPSGYEEELRKASCGFAGKINRLTRAGKLAMIHLTRDWNGQAQRADLFSPPETRLEVDTTHNMLLGGVDERRPHCERIAAFALDFFSSGKNEHEMRSSAVSISSFG